MARLTKAEIEEIAKEKGLTIVNPEEYVNLSSELTFKCAKGHNFITSIGIVRDSKFENCPLCERQEVKKVGQPPVKKGYRIIGFDQATKHFGISIFDDGQLVYYDCVDFNDANTEVRLAKISKFVDSVCKQWQPDFIVFEDIQLQGGAAGFTTFKTLAELLGIVIAAVNINGVAHLCVSNKVWQSKYMIAGKDRVTQKNNVIKKVKMLFGVDVSDDIADAILIGKYAVDMKRLGKEQSKRSFLF